jgi:hypothetical protein
MARGLREEAACSEAHNLEVQRFSGKGKGCAIICAFYSSTTPSMILVFSTCLKNISSQFFDLGIENPLGRGTLAKIELTLYRTSVPETCRVVTCSITGVQSRYPPVEHSQMPRSQRCVTPTRWGKESHHGVAVPRRERFRRAGAPGPASSLPAEVPVKLSNKQAQQLTKPEATLVPSPEGS